MSNKTFKGFGVLWIIMKPVSRYICSAVVLGALGAIAIIITLLMLSLVVAVLLQVGKTLQFWGIAWTITGALTSVGVVGAVAFVMTMLGFAISHLGASIRPH